MTAGEKCILSRHAGLGYNCATMLERVNLEVRLKKRALSLM